MKKYLIFVIIPTIAVHVLINIVVPNPSKQDTKEYIRNATASGNHLVAKREYKKLIDSDFENLEYHRGYISSHYELPSGTGKNNYRNDNAIFAYYSDKSASSDPNVSDIGWYCLGYIRLQEKDYARAIKFFSKVKNRDMKFLNNSMGYCFMEMNEYEQAKEHFKREINIGGNTEGAINNYARVLLRENNSKELTKIIANPNYGKMIYPSIKRRYYFVSNRFISYLLSIVASYRESIILEGFVAALIILIIWFVFIHKLDIFEPEKLRFLLLAFAISVICSELAYPLYDFFHLRLGFRFEGSILHELAYCIFGIGFIEESVKLIPVFVILLCTKQLNESTDFIIYASVSALGFAFMENLGYFDEFGLRSIGGRAIGCTLLHMALSSIAIYGLVYARYKKKSLAYFGLSFLFACLVHGLYDFWLLTESQLAAFSYISLFILVISIEKSKRIIANALNQSEFFKNGDNEGALRKDGTILIYGLSGIIVVQYLIIAVKFGPEFANHDMAPRLLYSYLLIWVIYANIKQFSLKQRIWTPLFERKKRKKKECQSD